MRCSIPDSSVLHYFLEFAKINVHWFSIAIQPSHPLPPPFSFCLQSFLAPESFPMSRLFVSGSQSIRASASASVLPMNIQVWFPLGLIGLISLRSKGLSRVFSKPQFESINSSVLSLLYGLTFTSVHDHWKNHSFDYIDLYRQSDISAFEYAI